ncbi:GTPase domain-containing protein [Prevotella pectinovora]|uniref:GTPase domain-containing protein n=1 Tax=Prevotella pectinovora TaxID=1602169 RepID=UPI0005C76E18|nr:GTPase domain-containing protein [Prevotella pectinovora]
MKYINKLQKSSSRYYNFLEKTVKEMRDYAISSDFGYDILCANYLNEDRFENEEGQILSAFNSDDTSNQTLIYGAVIVQQYEDTDSNLINALLITDERILVHLYVTDDQEHDFEYYYYCEWNQLASAKKKKDEDDDDVIVLIDDENEEVGFLYAQLLGGCYDNMAISNQWIDFFNDAIREASKPMGQSMEDNNIFKAFMSNKLLFKPFVSWPDCVHLGLNNVDAISNKLLYEITLRRGEQLLWVSRHKANWKAKDNDEKTPSGCIITDQRICYFNLNDNKKSFTAEWSEVATIMHMTNSFYIQKSLGTTSYDLKISDYALFDKKVENSNPVVIFLTNLLTNKEQKTKKTKEQLTSEFEDQLEQISNRKRRKDKRVVQKNDEPQKVVKSSSSKVKCESVDVSSDKNKPTQSLSSKDEIKKAYKNLQDILQDTQWEVSDLNGVNSQFNTVKDKIAFAFDTKIKEAKKELNVALKDTVWDKLVIAFFGETNAGKSTIIETFRILFDDKRKKEDGLIVGDGRHDFTKTYEEYHLSIAGHPFTLIDVPGIEGNESEFKDVIKTALHKAHCVFYVQGHNKKPDRATAEKIKKYLGDWVKVYSIYNVRGGVSNYDEEEERETLITPGVLKSESLIQAEFKTILGDVYAGHVTLQGLLAMSAKASFSPKREDLIRGQQKLLKYFGGSADKVLEFSQFKTLTTLVEQKALNFKSEIIEANKQKLVSLAGNIAADIEQVMESQKSYLANLDSNLRTINREVCNNSMDSALRNITNKTRNAITSSYGELKSRIFNLINDEPENIHQLAEQHQQEVIWNLENRIKSIVNEELNKVRNTANRKIKDLDGVNIRPIQFNRTVDVGADIDFSGALEELDVDFNDVLEWTAKTAGTATAGAFLGSMLGSVIPVAGTLVGAGIGAVVGGIAHACTGDGGKADARKSVSDAITKATQQANNNINSMLRPVIKDINDQKRQLSNSVKEELSNIEELQDTLDSFDDEIAEFVNGLKHKRYGRI